MKLPDFRQWATNVRYWALYVLDGVPMSDWNHQVERADQLAHGCHQALSDLKVQRDYTFHLEGEVRELLNAEWRRYRISYTPEVGVSGETEYDILRNVDVFQIAVSPRPYCINMAVRRDEFLAASVMEPVRERIAQDMADKAAEAVRLSILSAAATSLNFRFTVP